MIAVFQFVPQVVVAEQVTHELLLYDNDKVWRRKLPDVSEKSRRSSNVAPNENVAEKDDDAGNGEADTVHVHVGVDVGP